MVEFGHAEANVSTNKSALELSREKWALTKSFSVLGCKASHQRSSRVALEALDEKIVLLETENRIFSPSG